MKRTVTIKGFRFDVQKITNRVGKTYWEAWATDDYHYRLDQSYIKLMAKLFKLAEYMEEASQAGSRLSTRGWRK